MGRGLLFARCKDRIPPWGYSLVRGRGDGRVCRERKNALAWCRREKVAGKRRRAACVAGRDCREKVRTRAGKRAGKRLAGDEISPGSAGVAFVGRTLGACWARAAGREKHLAQAFGARHGAKRGDLGGGEAQKPHKRRGGRGFRRLFAGKGGARRGGLAAAQAIYAGGVCRVTATLLIRYRKADAKSPFFAYKEGTFRGAFFVG